jgi:hypothetical protein
MRYYEISKEMSSFYFGLAVFCLFEARVLEFDTQPLSPSSSGLHRTHCTLSPGSLASNWQKPKIQQRYLFADLTIPHLWSSSRENPRPKNLALLSL